MTHPDRLQDEDLATEREPLMEPARGWRNWWRLYRPTFVQCYGCKNIHHQGDGYSFDYDGCCEVWPSKDLAESNAASVEYDESCEQAKVEYLGAFPEGERP